MHGKYVEKGYYKFRVSDNVELILSLNQPHKESNINFQINNTYNQSVKSPQ